MSANTMINDTEIGQVCPECYHPVEGDRCTHCASSTGSVASARESVELAKTIISRDTHKWRWHATGAGMGWVCDGECDGHHRYTGDDNPPPKYGCARPQNSEPTRREPDARNQLKH